LKRIKQRYLALQVDVDVAPTPKEFVNAVWGAVTKLYGEYGASHTSLTLIDYNAEKKTAVIRTALTTVGMVRTSLATITSVANREAAVHVMAVSGTKKALARSGTIIRT
jgi:RNase P/RNase MRP subunit POP5